MSSKLVSQASSISGEIGDPVICDRMTMWLTRTDIILEQLKTSLEKNNCHIETTKENLLLRCGECTAEITIWEEDPSPMIEALGTIAKEAVKQGYKAIKLEIKLIPQTCSQLCETIKLLLMRGGS